MAGAVADRRSTQEKTLYNSDNNTFLFLSTYFLSLFFLFYSLLFNSVSFFFFFLHGIAPISSCFPLYYIFCFNCVPVFFFYGIAPILPFLSFFLYWLFIQFFPFQFLRNSTYFLFFPLYSNSSNSVPVFMEASATPSRYSNLYCLLSFTHSDALGGNTACRFVSPCTHLQSL